MKKVVSILSLVAIILSMSITAFAGSIPEDLLMDQSQIFFAEVVYYHPNKEKVLTTSQALNLLRQRGYLIKDDPLPAS